MRRTNSILDNNKTPGIHIRGFIYGYPLTTQVINRENSSYIAPEYSWDSLLDNLQRAISSNLNLLSNRGLRFNPGEYVTIQELTTKRVSEP